MVDSRVFALIASQGYFWLITCPFNHNEICTKRYESNWICVMPEKINHYNVENVFRHEGCRFSVYRDSENPNGFLPGSLLERRHNVIYMLPLFSYIQSSLTLFELIFNNN